MLARRLNQTSTLGALLDPLADRLYILATLAGLVLRDIIPLWLAIVIVGRDVILTVALAVLRHYGYAPFAVHYLGKAATFCLLYAFPFLLIGAAPRHRGRRRPADRVGVHDLGDRAVPLGRRGVPEPDPPACAAGAPMTAQRGPAGNALGAQLLVDLVTNTLDPGYAAAAKQRGPTPPRRWFDRPAVAIGCALIGFTLVVAYIHTHRGAPEAAKVHDSLVSRVRSAQHQVDRLAGQAQQLNGALTTLRDQALPGDSALSRQLDREQLLAGQVAAVGPGLQVVLKEPPPVSRSAPPGRAGSTRSARPISSPTVMCAASSTNCGPTAPRRSR